MRHRDPDSTGLEPSQLRAIESLADSADVSRAAGSAGVEAERVREWLSRDPEFIAGLNRAKSERGDRLRAGVRGLADDAFATLRGLISGPHVPPAVRLKAAMAVLETANAMRGETIGSTSAAEIQADLMNREPYASLRL
jgi:hypothetical protein